MLKPMMQSVWLIYKHIFVLLLIPKIRIYVKQY